MDDVFQKGAADLSERQEAIVMSHFNYFKIYQSCHPQKFLTYLADNFYFQGMGDCTGRSIILDWILTKQKNLVEEMEM